MFLISMWKFELRFLLFSSGNKLHGVFFNGFGYKEDIIWDAAEQSKIQNGFWGKTSKKQKALGIWKAEILQDS